MTVCLKCAGCTVVDELPTDMSYQARVVRLRRCLNCGWMWDRVLVRNRLRRPVGRVPLLRDFPIPVGV